MDSDDSRKDQHRGHRGRYREREESTSPRNEDSRDSSSGHSGGNREGHSGGYREGHSGGYREGHSGGYREGHSGGYREGHSGGYERSENRHGHRDREYGRGRGYDHERRYDNHGGGQVRGGRNTYPEGSSESGYKSQIQKRPADDPMEGSSKHQRTDDTACPSSSGTGKGNGSSNDQQRERPDLYEIVRTRPQTLITKKGTTGNGITLLTNFFKLNKKPSWELLQYRVDFDPECDIVGKRKGLMKTQKELLGGYLYDTNNLIYLTHRLPQDNMIVDCQDRDGNNSKITFKFTSVVSMDTRESLQILNLILRRAMDGLKLQLVGRNLFDAAASIDIHEFNLQIWPGYITSIRQHENDILLCAEVASKVMRKETVYDILMQCKRRGGNFVENFKEEVLGMIVLTDYNNETYRVCDIRFESKPSDTFGTKKWGEISFIQYYKRKYDITIHHPLQPMLVARSKVKKGHAAKEELISLIPELCRPTGLSDNQRSNINLMKRVSVYTRLYPKNRMQKLNEFNGRLRNTPASVDMLRTWNFQLDNRLLEVPGRVYKNENIHYGDSQKKPTSEKADWQFRDKSMYVTCKLINWIILVPFQMSHKVEPFVRHLITISRPMKFSVNRPMIQTIVNDRSPSYATGFEQAVQSNPQLIMAFVPNNNADRYAVIKKLGCVNYGVPTQVIVDRTLNNNKGIKSIATKVLIQLNCKVGGVPWLVHIPVGGLMTVGIDVSRDSREKTWIWEGLVATMDLKNGTEDSFFSTVTRHEDTEYSTQLALNMVKALNCYRQMNGGALPKKICIYRDGVGEGQTRYVYETEIKQVKERLNAIYGQSNETPKFNFILVSKRINAKIFTQDGNPPPGTIVDDVITLPERHDFYLVSQSVRQGTVSPTSYNVLHNGMELSPDYMQQLTYKQTHLYYNWCGTIRVPAVCQFAHKLTFLVAQFLHIEPLSKLEKKLYFL